MTIAKKRNWDVIIVGLGPGGSAAAIQLAQWGWNVLMIEKRGVDSFKFGESLSPFALDAFEKLIGPIDQLDADYVGFHFSAGNLSSWHSQENQLQDFYFTPQGKGLCIDRSRFDLAIAEKAESLGAVRHELTEFVQCHRHDRADNWTVEIKQDNQSKWLHCKYLIDASGRASVVASALGVERQKYDNLFALAQRFIQNSQNSKYKEDIDRFTRIEASPDGWWYSNRLPSLNKDQSSSERVVVFHTDIDNAAAKKVATISGFDESLRMTAHLQNMLKEFGYQAKGKVRGTSATTERLLEFSDEGWFAVGDAAMAFDPLSSQGISNALYSGILVAELIATGLTQMKKTGQRQSDLFLSKQFNEEQEKVWRTYRQDYKDNYQLQRRWSSHPFWARRQIINETEYFREAP